MYVIVTASSFDQGSRFEKMKHNRRELEGVVVFRIVISSTFPWLVEELARAHLESRGREELKSVL